ncbi:MAG: Phosphoribosylglycinamide formyltransferase [Pelotomaculum sp. PtaB.Bin104]|nr:MAG: Phosphoribosylglycinamide formyltransferase [Pelotomaculum sp. PtaB.Bin104]
MLIEQLVKGGSNLDKLRLGILASGRGSNLQAIMDAADNGKIYAEVVLVISDRQDAYALERARQRDIPAEFVNPKNFTSKAEYEKVIVELLNRYGVELVCLAGYMRIVGDTMLKAFPDKIINIHPALLPAFPGLHGQEQAWRHGVKFSGCTVHFVDERVDSGPIIIQAVVPVLEDDTADTLAARILEQEHIIYPEAIRRYSEGRLKIVGRKVITCE